MPRWVKVFVGIAIVGVALIALLLATGHGPGRHLRSTQAPASSATTHGIHQP